jgi:hypothetical protein
MKKYLLKVRDVITFLIFWIMPGFIIEHYTGNADAHLLLVIIWIPAIAITGYLRE